jgi:hypothetical protein
VRCAIAAALVRRGAGGPGGYVEIPMLEPMVAFNLVEHFLGLHFAPPRGGAGYGRALSPHRGPFRCSDGFVK